MELKAKQDLGEKRKIMKNGHPDAIAVAFWQSTHFQGFTEFLRQVITDRPHARLEYWFSGAAHFYIRIVDDIQWISSVHRTKEILETKKKAGILQWDGPYKAPPKSS
jgi:hypothetical protein